MCMSARSLEIIFCKRDVPRNLTTAEDNSNLNNSNSISLPLIKISLKFTPYFEFTANSHCFLFPFRVWVTGVLLYLLLLKSYKYGNDFLRQDNLLSLALPTAGSDFELA